MKQDPTRSAIAPYNSPILLLAILVAPIPLSLLADSASFAQTGPAAATDAPALTAEAGESAIELSRTAVSGAARYELWAWSTAGGWHRLDDGNLTGTTYRHTQTAPGTEYYYAVRAIAPDGSASAWSNHPLATAPQTASSTSTPTATPTASALTPPTLTAAAGQNAVELSWTASSGGVRDVAVGQAPFGIDDHGYLKGKGSEGQTGRTVALQGSDAVPAGLGAAAAAVARGTQRTRQLCFDAPAKAQGSS